MKKIVYSKIINSLKILILGKKNALLPWENLRQINASTNGNFTDAVKEEILALSQVFIELFINFNNLLYFFNKKNLFTNSKIFIE